MKDFRFLTTKPSAGWTASKLVTPQVSAVGPVNALAQNNVTADSLRTTASSLADPSLGSRKYVNPNTGIRDVAASGSVYAQPDVPAFLSQAVSSLNAEQSLRRSLQAEWNDKLLRGATGQIAGADPYVWMEALRAASVSPGASVAFGQQIADPNAGRAALSRAHSLAGLEAVKTNILHQALGTQYNLGKVADPIFSPSWVPVGSASANPGAASAALAQQAAFLKPIATSAAGGGSGWSSGSSWWK